MGVQTIIIKDETVGGDVQNEFVLNFMDGHVTVADIIRERVTQEVDAYNRRIDDRFFGLVQPNDTEASLNGYKFRKKRKVDAGKQIETALKAFQQNAFFMLIDDVQAENLDDLITLKPDMSVSFVKLTPLVGG